MDLFLAHCYHDGDFAGRIEGDLSGRGLVVGEPLPLWRGRRLLPPIDRRLRESRLALVIISRAFLALRLPREELDGLATRRNVYAILSDVGEAEVASQSPRLAVAAVPGSLANRLVHLVRPEDAVE